MPPDEHIVADKLADEHLEQPRENPSPQRRFVLLGFIAALLMVSGYMYWLVQSPLTEEMQVTVEPGQSVSSIVAEVADAGVVRSENLLYLITQLNHGDENINTGTYTFTPAQSVFAVAEHLMTTTPADELVSVTLPEGISVATMARIFNEHLTAFDTDTFTRLAADYEGLLWPDTYFVPLTYTAEDVFTLLTENHLAAMATYYDTIAVHPLNEYEVIILASIIEREANDETSMKMVAGILLSRLAIGMALQADATMEYVLEQPLNELAPGELAENIREVDSPYNTYRYTGLPPTPIGNPGRDAIEAVLYPTESDYLFYLTGNDGAFHYAETYEQHRVNIERYLR